MIAHLPDNTYTVTRNPDGTITTEPAALGETLAFLAEHGIELEFQGPGGARPASNDLASLRTYVQQVGGTISDDQYVEPLDPGTVN